MTKILQILLRLLWLTICLTPLMYAFKAYQGTSDWRVEEGLALAMIAVSFPASLLVVAGLILVGAGLRLFGLGLPASSRPEMTATWFLFVAAGYAQWFVVVLGLVTRWHNKSGASIVESLCTWGVALLILGLVAIFFFRYPVVLLALLMAGLAYCIYRIIKDKSTAGDSTH